MMLKLRWLKVGKYRIVQQGTELHFNDDYNLLLGRNGAGKTTLLDLIAMIFSSSFAGLEEEEFDLEYELSVPLGALQVHVRNQREDGPKRASCAYSVALRFTPSGPESLAFTARTNRGFIELDGARVETSYFSANGTPFEADSFLSRILLNCAYSLQPTLPMEVSQWPPLPKTLVQLNKDTRQRQSQRFDESTEWLRDCIALARISMMSSLENEDVYISDAARTPFELEAALERRLKSPAAVLDKEIVSFQSDRLQFLGHAVRALGYKEATLHLELLGAVPWPDSARQHAELRTFGNLRLFFTKRDGSRLPLDHLSFGQRRLVAFFYYLATHPPVLIADELVNGLDHAMIAQCLAAAGERQKFLAAHNPLLLAHLEQRGGEQVRAALIRCECRTEGPREQMAWSALTAEQAHDLYEDCRLGTQHRSEAPRTGGVW